MKKTKLLAATAMLLLTSCSPKVVTNIVRTYPGIIPADSMSSVWEKKCPIQPRLSGVYQ